MKDVRSLWLVGLFVVLTEIASAQAGTGKIATEKPGPPCAATDYSTAVSSWISRPKRMAHWIYDR